MAIEVHLKKQLKSFCLEMHLESESRRIGILGASGCGKSMTLRGIAGVEQPDRGRIRVDGQLIYDSGKHLHIKPQKRGIGYLFQNYALFPTMTVAENIGAGVKGSREERRIKVARMIEKFRLSGLEEHLPHQLSGGQQQRTALARIMAYEPGMLLLDEPFSALDENLKDRVQQELLELLEDYPGTVILVSHSRDEIFRFSEELVIMDQGRAICHGKTEEIFRSPGYVKAASLTGCKNIAALKRLDAHHGQVPEWGLTLHAQCEIPADATHLGIRAHEFVPIWEFAGEKETSFQVSGALKIPVNCLPVQVKSVAFLPFETKYFLKGQTEAAEEICWFLQRERQQEVEKRGLPRWLRLPENQLLFLK